MEEHLKLPALHQLLGHFTEQLGGIFHSSSSLSPSLPLYFDSFFSPKKRNNPPLDTLQTLLSVTGFGMLDRFCDKVHLLSFSVPQFALLQLNVFFVLHIS